MVFCGSSAIRSLARKNYHLQWSLHFKTTRSASKISSYIEGGFKMEGYLHKSMRVGSLVDDLKMEGFVKWRGLKLQAPLYISFGKLPISF